MTAERLPEPDAEALAVSQALTARIVREIDAGGGWIAFDRFMQMALYEPGLGYYSAGAAKFGAHGDFTTASELGDWLAEALAAFVGSRLRDLGSSRVLELGAGSGRLAEGLIAGLGRRGCSGLEFSILEPSADLRERQRARLEAAACRARWLDGLPERPFDGIVVANEVADALPVSRFVKLDGRCLPLGVARRGDGLAIVPGAPDPALSAAVDAIEAARGSPLPDGYRSEVCLSLGPWLAGVLGSIGTGGLLLIDYGLPRRDYYRAERLDGTLICHYRQRAHADPLLWPGLQDITAWVDFSAVAEAAQASGFSVSGFTTQAQFLLESIAADPELAREAPTPAAASALKTLVLPGEMGERFKLIWLTRRMDPRGLPGRDFRSWLSDRSGV